jgi:hypothetical protein
MADVIELGEDGSFDIASTPVKQKYIENGEFEEFRTVEASFIDFLKDSLATHEFKIYRSDDNFAYLIILLDQEEDLISVVVDNRVIAFKTKQKVYSVDLSELGANYDLSDLKANKWNQYVVIKIQLK